MNNNPRVFYQNLQESTPSWKISDFDNGLYDIIISDQSNSGNYEYNSIYLSKDGDYIKLIGGKLAFDTEYNRLKITMKGVFQAKTYTRGCFENNSANFYF